MIRFALPLAALLLAACPKATPVNVAGTDDEQMDQLSAQLEEVKSRQDVSCQDACGMKSKVSSLSSAVCELAGKHTDRDDFQKHCISAQEELAKLNDSCSSCNK
ncbi:MAG: hypothetical protein K1X89_12200 [Myxococcaceae bacterium]|nr:hypothetical protein [Myxococcaceae bacterium]